MLTEMQTLKRQKAEQQVSSKVVTCNASYARPAEMATQAVQAAAQHVRQTGGVRVMHCLLQQAEGLCCRA